MTWIESHSELRDHPKRKRLSRTLGLDLYQTIGLLNCLWWWVMDYAPDGDLSRFENADIADGLDYPGDPDELMAALRSTGFIDGDQVHDWEDYGEKLFRRREANAERMRAARAKHVQSTCATRAELEDRTGQDREDKKKRARATPTKAKKADEPVDNPTVARLVTQMREIPDWRDKPDDAAFVEVALQTYSPQQIQRTISELAIRQAASHEYRELRKALGNWLKRASPEVRPPSHTPFRPPDEREPTEVERAESIARLREMTRGIGRVMA